MSSSSSHSLADLLAVRPFLHFWWARLTGQLASQMVMVALGWQMYELTGSAWDLGLVGLAQFLPALLLTLPAGHVADRHNRARIVLACTALQWAAITLLCTATLTDSITREGILGLSVAFGVARAFQMPASQALTPSLVPPSLLPRAMAVNASGIQVAVIGGPALAGGLFALGIGWVYGVSVGVSALSLWLMSRVRVPAAESRGAADWRSVLDLFAVLLGGATALLPIFVKEILQAGPWALGLLRAAPAGGALLMSLWLARHPLQHGVGRQLIGWVAVFGVCMGVFALSTQVWLSFVALFISGVADMVSVVIRQTLVQLETPDDMRGRVSAVNSVFIGASNQLGEFESGATAAWLGPVGSVLLGGVGVLLVAGLWIRLFPALWARDRLQPE